MPGKAVGRAAAALPWLCPNTDSLIRLAEDPTALTRPCGSDPALVALLLRFAPPDPQPIGGLFCPSALVGAALPDAAAALLAATPGGWVPPSSEVSRRCQALTERAAAFARVLAEHTRRACPQRADVVARLAPLGWLAVATIDPGAAAEPLHDPEAPAAPAVQAQVWGLDQNAIARRLANRWRMPDWVASILGNLSLPLGAARAVVADLGIFAVVGLAVCEAEKRLQPLGLTHGSNRDEVLEELALTESGVDELWAALPGKTPESLPAAQDQNPHRVPLVRNLLRLAGESRRRNGASLVARLEDRLDELHGAVGGIGADADARVRDAKLAALAELAAGAGHEINNPLAIISGNAQRLFRTEPEPERGESLQIIIRQTERIAGIIRDLMHFARPPRPAPHRNSAAELLEAARADVVDFAAEKGVRLELGPVAPSSARCDRAQVRHALGALVRNGVEAAGKDGWVRLSSPECDEEFVAFVVEDSGPGLSPAAREHAFDPFYCGRPAGRGRGLGLPTAWRFARQNGGDLRHETSPSGVTRFVLTVPRSVTLEFLDRQSA